MEKKERIALLLTRVMGAKLYDNCESFYESAFVPDGWTLKRPPNLPPEAYWRENAEEWMIFDEKNDQGRIWDPELDPGAAIELLEKSYTKEIGLWDEDWRISFEFRHPPTYCVRHFNGDLLFHGESFGKVIVSMILDQLESSS